MGEDTQQSSRKSGKRPWHQSLIKKYHHSVLLQALLPPIPPIIIVLIQAILWPGYIYCSDTSCPTSFQPAIPDTAMIPIAIVLYVYSAFWGFLILFASGSWMAHAFRDKLLVISMFFLIACSYFQLFAPFGYRGYVAPYYEIQPYAISTIPTENSTSLTITNLWNSIYTDPSGKDRNVMVEVREASGQEKYINDLSPLSKVIYKDQEFTSTTILSEGVAITRQIGELEDGKWYMSIVSPSHKGVNGDAFESRPVITLSNTIDLFNSSQISAIDLRAFKLCKWNSQIGCLPGSIH